jgi:MinD-like ATPase involved in chromosome partitioning or flagellar assembly
VERLQAEGWVECSGLGFPALAQQSLTDLTTFVLEQLQENGGSIGLADLQLATLIFSVPIHQYEVHPHLPSVLKQLEAAEAIEISKPRSPAARAILSCWQ